MILEILIEQGNNVYDFPITPQSKFVDIAKCFYGDKYNQYTLVENNNGIERKMNNEDNVFHYSLENANLDGVYYILRGNEYIVPYGKHDADNIQLLQQRAKQQALQIEKLRNNIHAKEQRIKFLKHEQLKQVNVNPMMYETSFQERFVKKFRTVEELERKLKLIKQEKNSIGNNNLIVSLSKDFESDLIAYNKHLTKQKIDFQLQMNYIKSLVDELKKSTKTNIINDHINIHPSIIYPNRDHIILSTNKNKNEFNDNVDYINLKKDISQNTLISNNSFSDVTNKKLQNSPKNPVNIKPIDPFQIAINIGGKIVNKDDINSHQYTKENVFKENAASRVAKDNHIYDHLPNNLKDNVIKNKIHQNYLSINPSIQGSPSLEKTTFSHKSHHVVERKNSQLPIETTAPPITFQPSSPLSYQLLQGPKLLFNNNEERQFKNSSEGTSPIVKYTRPIAITSPLMREIPIKVEDGLTKIDQQSNDNLISLDMTGDNKLPHGSILNEEENLFQDNNTFIEHSTTFEDNSLNENTVILRPKNTHLETVSNLHNSLSSNLSKECTSQFSDIDFNEGRSSILSSFVGDAESQFFESQMLSPMILDMMDGSFNNQRFSFNEDAPRPLRRKLNLLGHQLSDSYNEQILNHLTRLDDNLKADRIDVNLIDDFKASGKKNIDEGLENSNVKCNSAINDAIVYDDKIQNNVHNQNTVTESLLHSVIPSASASILKNHNIQRNSSEQNSLIKNNQYMEKTNMSGDHLSNSGKNITFLDSTNTNISKTENEVINTIPIESVIKNQANNKFNKEIDNLNTKNDLNIYISSIEDTSLENKIISESRIHSSVLDQIISKNLNQSLFPSIDDSFTVPLNKDLVNITEGGFNSTNLEKDSKDKDLNIEISSTNFDELDSKIFGNTEILKLNMEAKPKKKLVFEKSATPQDNNLLTDYFEFEDDVTNSVKKIEVSYKAPPKGLKGKLKKAGAKSRLGSSVRVRFDPLILLLDAALQGELEVVKKSIKQLSNISACDDEGVTALHNAVCGGHIDIVKFLIEIGCDVNAGDGDMWSPLHCAASLNNLAICKMLIEGGACPFAIANDDGKSAAMKCDPVEEGYEECKQYLLSIEEKMGSKNNSIVYAMFEYDALREDEVKLSINDRVKVLSKGGDEEGGEIEWWVVELDDQTRGYAPRNYLSLYKKILPS